MKIKTLDKPDLMTVLDWAAREGWNPGLDDVDAFFLADATGYHGVFDGDELVSCVSVVKHDPLFAFLGLYLCRPDYRGKGYGWQAWQAGMASAEGTVGLDGVVEQQDNYQRSGFEFAWTNSRYHGMLSSADVSEGTGDWKVCRASTLTAASLAAFDQAVTGINRPAFATGWYSDSTTRQTYVIQSGGRISAVGTIRQCQEGYKVGPLFCPDEPRARSLLAEMLTALPPVEGGHDIYLDVPLNHPAAVSFVDSLGMKPVFETARMYRGTPPSAQHSMVFGLTTLELG